MLVLVADKDPQDLEALASCLKASDQKVMTARDGAEIVDLAMEHSPEAIVVAASLGQMGGFAVSRHLKTCAEAGEISEPKILVLLEREADAWLAAWSRCDAWLCEPIDPVDVADRVRELLSASPAGV